MERDLSLALAETQAHLDLVASRFDILSDLGDLKEVKRLEADCRRTIRELAATGRVPADPLADLEQELVQLCAWAEEVTSLRAEAEDLLASAAGPTDLPPDDGSEFPEGEESDLPPEDAADLPPADPAGPSTVTVVVDKVTLIPGAIAGGSVTFSDGVTGKWIIDQQYRPGFTEISQSGYRPSPADAQAFMKELGRAMQSRGF